MSRPQQPMRLNIPPPMNLNMQQPGQAMWSPALPTSIQNGFHAPFPMPSMHTPMQQYFNPPPPHAPGRPTHRGGQQSMAQLSAVGIHPPNGGFPITPMGGHFPRPSMMLGPGGIPQAPSNGHPFPNRNRRQLSIGGPPKAVLGGPARKLSPLPPNLPEAVPAVVPAVKQKKVVVNLPKETANDGEEAARPSWARTPLPQPANFNGQQVVYAEITSAEPYPPEEWRVNIPSTLDVFLPGKRAWDTIKQQAIEEKLERLGVERGNIPHIHAPHARAASISSPADPALLLFKLNKLQQLQNASSNNSLSTSPQPPGLSPSPNQLGPRFITNRHGHSMSLSQPPTHQQAYMSAPLSPVSLNPFGPNATLGLDSPRRSPAPPSPLAVMHAPQGRTPVVMSSLAPPLSASRPDSRPDFTRGFGLDIPEESEEDEAEAFARGEESPEEPEFVANVEDESYEAREETDIEDELEDDGLLTASQSRHHSRHVSRLSAALSLRSLGGLVADGLQEETDQEPIQGLINMKGKGREPTDLLDDVEEWTGSEDVFLGGEESEDEESIGEWSNPSDEERARQQRVERRTRRRAARQNPEEPRRLPNFPRPPDNTVIVRPRDDDIISNPSEEENLRSGRQGDYLGIESADYYNRPSSNSTEKSNRPLPPLPHSRATSGQHSVHDPAHAHSRQPSGNAFTPGHTKQQSTGTRLSLNPFAKPFVFGAPLQASGSWKPDVFGSEPASTTISPSGHARLPSLGKPLNVAAPEFKPGAFSFKSSFPLPIPTLPISEMPRPLPAPPEDASPFKVQGREKRQRRGSSASIEEGDSMASFKFPPNYSSPNTLRRASSPEKPAARGALNPAAAPFTFAGFSAAANLPRIPTAETNEAEETYIDDTARADHGDSEGDDFSFPSTIKSKRAPIPLDFKHPVSNNTVPAGLFKALVSGDERTRRTVRSRLSSHEIFDHIQRPSLDDIDVEAISLSHKVSRQRLVTDPGNRQASPIDDVFGPARHNRRRSSLPDTLHHSSVGSSMSEASSIAAQHLTSRMEMHSFEDRLERLIESKLVSLRQDLAKRDSKQSLNPATEAMITDVVAMFRSQLQDSASRGLEDSQMDARGELDFELIKDMLEQKHDETLATLKVELADLIPRILQSRGAPGASQDLTLSLEHYSSRTVEAVIEAISELTTRLESVGRAAPAREHDAIVDALVSALSPIVTSLRPEIIDYDYLTDRLTQSVKPHISQLIDLASDKRETAGLIVERLLPILTGLQQAPVALDTEALTLALTTEVRRAIAPIDAFEIKEQVADLVVERLDSRLAVRDKSFNVDTVTGRVTDGLSRMLEPMENFGITLSTLVEGQRSLASQQSDISSAHRHVVEVISELPPKIMSAVEALKADLVPQPIAPVVNAAPDENILQIKSDVEGLTTKQQTLNQQNSELLSLQKDAMEKLNSLPDALAASSSVLQSAHAEFALIRDSHKREVEDLRKSNTDYQVQMAKARGAHGQVRVEKDVLSEKFGVMEGDRDRLRAQVKELQTTASTKVAECVAAEARNSELEDALAKALSRLQASDVATQANQDRIAELEKANHDLLSEKHTLKTKVDSLDLQVTFASRDKESAEKALGTLQKQHDHLAAQQSHWDDLRHASEKIEMLTTLIGQADNEELRELRRSRDRTKMLEGEHIALQKRFKEQEAKLVNNDKAVTAARQSLTQAQNRSSEWEIRAKEYEGQLELTKTKLEHAEQTQSQINADYSLVKMQLEEREADGRLAKDREGQLRDKATALEAKVTRLQAELAQAVANKIPAKLTNGNLKAHQPISRPDSRASAAYNDALASNRRLSGSSHGTTTPHLTSSWAHIEAPSRDNSLASSMHAPGNRTSLASSMHAPGNRYPASLSRATPQPQSRRPYSRTAVAPPSPTPSTVSLAPTLGEDGWYS